LNYSTEYDFIFYPETQVNFMIFILAQLNINHCY